MSDLMNSLNIQRYPERWDRLFCIAMKEYETNGAFFLQEPYIERLNDEFDLFDDWLGVILQAAEKVRNNSSLERYIFLLQYAMTDRTAFASEISEVFPPLPRDGVDTLAYDFVLLFSLLPLIPPAARAMKNRGVPEAIYRDTLKAYRYLVDLTYDIYGKPGLAFGRYISWIQLYLDALILRIGRLDFEVRKHFNGSIYVFKNKDNEFKVLMRDVRLQKGMVFGSSGYKDEILAVDSRFLETDPYYEGYPVNENGLADGNRIRLEKEKWSMMLTSGDSVIEIHIPGVSHAGKLSQAACEKSYEDARLILMRCYPEYNFKAFSCSSWMMDHQLTQFLSPEAGLVQFQKKFILYPRIADGKGVFSFVFTKPFSKLEDLPEETSLQQALKRHYIDGKYIYEMGGIFF